jgi:hypothetical protein
MISRVSSANSPRRWPTCAGRAGVGPDPARAIRSCAKAGAHPGGRLGAGIARRKERDLLGPPSSSWRLPDDVGGPSGRP